MSPLLTRRGTWTAPSPQRSFTPPPSAPRLADPFAVAISPPTALYAHEAPASLGHGAWTQASAQSAQSVLASDAPPPPLTAEAVMHNGFIITRFDGPSSFAPVVDSTSSRSSLREAHTDSHTSLHASRIHESSDTLGNDGFRDTHTTADQERLERGSFAHVQQQLSHSPGNRSSRHAFRAARSISPHPRHSSHPYERPPSPGRHHMHGEAHQPRSDFRSDSAHSQEGRRERRPSNARAHPYRPSSPLIAQRGRSNSMHAREEHDRRPDAPPRTHDASGAFIALPELSLQASAKPTLHGSVPTRKQELPHAALCEHIDHRRRNRSDHTDRPANTRHGEEMQSSAAFAAFTVWCNCSDRVSE
jgi:hypothetical protein